MNDVTSLPQAMIDDFVAAAHGDFDKVKRLIAERPELVHAEASWRERALEAASQTGRADIVEFLLAAGAQLDVCTSVMLGDMRQVEAFLSMDPNLINARGANDLPLMYFAAIRGYREIAEYLLQLGAEINAGRGGNTALHGAVRFGQTEMVSWLLANEADANSLDYNGKIPLQLAEENDQTEIAEFIRKSL